MGHLGHGIGLRDAHYETLLREGVTGVDWFEVISEDLFVEGGRAWEVLDGVRREVPVVLHGVSLGIGDVSPLSEEYIASLERVVERAAPAWLSDHLCWSSWSGRYAHDLLPLPYTSESLDHVAARVNRVQERLRRPLMLENISRYSAFGESTLAECDYLNALTRRTGCSLLLDVNNVYVTSKNLGFSAEGYIAAIDVGSVGQIHLAGHTPREGFLVDTHRGPVPEAVWALYRLAVGRFGRVPTLVEWDDEIPDYRTVVGESRRARRIEHEVFGAA